MTIELVAAFMVGVLTGLLIMYILCRSKPIGVINIDRSDPDGPYLFLELTGSISELSSKKHANFKVKSENYISPK